MQPPAPTPPPPPHLSPPPPPTPGRAQPMAVGPAEYWPLIPSDALSKGQRPDAFDLIEQGPRLWGIPAMVFVFLASTGAVYWLLSALFELTSVPEADLTTLAYFLGGLVLAGTVVVWIKQIAKVPLAVLGRSASPITDVFIGLGVGLLSFVAVTTVSVLTFPFLPEPKSDQLPDDIAGLSGALVLIGVIVCTPIGEELLVRGFIMGGLRRRLPFRASLWISALIFAAMHVAPARVVALLVSGLLFGLLYEKRRNILPSIVAHMTHNALAVVIGLAVKDAVG